MFKYLNWKSLQFIRNIKSIDTMPFKDWEPFIKKLSYKSRAVAYGLWSDKGDVLQVNEVLQDIISMGNGEQLKLMNPSIESLNEKAKENACIFVGYLTLGTDPLKTYTLYSKVFFQNNKFLIFCYLDIIETLKDNKELSKLNQEVNNLQRKLTKEKISLENAYEELNVLQAQLLERTNQLELLNDSLHEMNQEKNKYIGMVAHDLRSPISTVYSFANLLLEDLEELSSEEIKLFLRKIMTRSQFSLNMIEGFLDASKIESGILNINSEFNDFISCLNQSVENNQVFAVTKKQKLILSNKLEHLEFYFDYEKMQQVFDNLLSNAIKYSNPKSNISIDLQTEQENLLIFKVSDEGQGIAEEELHRVFKAFETTSAKATAGEKSTGLGLSIVKKIVEAHSGTIEVSSVLGKGTTFTMQLPIKTTH